VHAMKDTAAPESGKPSAPGAHGAPEQAGRPGGTDEQFWVRCWDRKRRLSGRISDLAEIGCTMDEISAALDMSPEYLRSRYGREWRRGLARLRARLRKSLVESAVTGKVPAQMWLGRLLLGRMEGLCEAEASDSLDELFSDMSSSETLEESVASAVKQGRG